MNKFEAKKILADFRLKPQKNLGQHFLINDDILSLIIKTAAIKKGDKIIEIGPGLGVLTKELLFCGAEVTAIEFDSKMVEILNDRFKEAGRFKLIQGDALDKICQIKLKDYKIVANLPYQITSPFFRKLFSLKELPRLIVILIQKEMAERIIALPHDSRRGYLSVLVQLYGQPEIISCVSRESFYPEPKVESAILRLEVQKLKFAPKKSLLKIIQAGFSQKRKKIRNSIAASFKIKPYEAEKIIEDSGIDANSRAEDLKINEWINLQKQFEDYI